MQKKSCRLAEEFQPFLLFNQKLANDTKQAGCVSVQLLTEQLLLQAHPGLIPISTSCPLKVDWISLRSIHLLDVSGKVRVDARLEKLSIQRNNIVLLIDGKRQERFEQLRPLNRFTM